MKNKEQRGWVLFLVLGCLGMVACGSEEGLNQWEAYQYASNRSVSFIEISTDKAVLSEDQNPFQLSIRVTYGDQQTLEDITKEYTEPLTGQKYTVWWNSSRPEVATVTEDGQAQPRSPGITQLEAHLGRFVAYKTLVVTRESLSAAFSQSSSSNGTGEQSPSTNGTSEKPAKKEGEPCQDFAKAVFSFSPGQGAGFGQDNYPAVVLGAPEGKGKQAGGTNVLSLGINGQIILDLGDCQVVDGAGPDFTVFENPFFIGTSSTLVFAELGAVGVSQDGIIFTEFPCTTAAYPYRGCAGWQPVISSTGSGISPFDPPQSGGDSFDLAEVGVTGARYIRIRDLQAGFSMPSPNARGFDLDAVAVINGVTNLKN